MVVLEETVFMVSISKYEALAQRNLEDHKRIRRLDILKEFPFKNYLMTAEIKGCDLLEFVEQAVAKAEHCLGAFPHFSNGVVVKYDSSKQPMHRLVEMTLNDQPIDPERIYTISTVNFLLEGGDDLTAMKKATIKEHQCNGSLMFDVICEWIECHRKLESKKEGRICDLSAKDTNLMYRF